MVPSGVVPSGQWMMVGQRGGESGGVGSEAPEGLLGQDPASDRLHCCGW